MPFPSRTWRMLEPVLIGPDPYEELTPPARLASRTLSQRGATLIVTATASQPGRRSGAPAHYWHWYINGRHAGRTRSGTRLLRLRRSGMTQIDVKPVRWRSYDGRAPQNLPCRADRVLEVELITGGGTGVRLYDLQYKTSAGSTWTTFARVEHTGRWAYVARTPQLADDTLYDVRAVPVGTDDVEGTPLAIATSRRIVGIPDAVEPEITFASGTAKLTYNGKNYMSGGDLDPMPT